MLRSGQTIEKYVVEAVLGSGASAEVYRVRHEQLRSVHALKVLAEVDGTRRDRMLEEGRVQASLRHPNLVGVTDVLQYQGRPALVMEYVNGPTLRDWLDQGGIPAPRRAVELCSGIARGMRYAHERGLIHRDLKPANVLLEVSPQGLVPRVLDFGLVRQTWSEGQALTELGTTLGTPAYMSPEQILDPSTVDERSDVFSLGCILYELVHGTAPFEGSDPVEVVKNIQSGRRRPISDNLAPGLQNLLDRMLAHDPAERVNTAAQIVAELADPELLRTEQLQAHPSTAMSSFDFTAPIEASPRNRLLWASFSLPAIALVVGAVVVLSGAPVQEAPGRADGSMASQMTVEADPAFSVEQRAVPSVPAPVEAARPAVEPVAAPVLPPPGPAPVPAPVIVPRTPVPAGASVPSAVPGADPSAVAAEPPAKPKTGAVKLHGDAKSITLVRGNSRTTRLDAVPAGTWRVRAEFESGEVDAGEVTISAGKTVDLRCVAFALRCKVD